MSPNRTKTLVTCIVMTLLAALLFVLFSCSSKNPGGGAPVVTHFSVVGAGPGTIPPADLRWDFESFVGHVAADANAEVFEKQSGMPVWAYGLVAGRRRVISRSLDFDETYELHEPIPYWTASLFKPWEKETGADGVTRVPTLGIIFSPPAP